MSAPLDQDLGFVAQARQPSLSVTADKEKAAMIKDDEVDSSSSQGGTDSSDEREPTMEELKTLRRVSGKLPWQIWTSKFNYVHSWSIMSSNCS